MEESIGNNKNSSLRVLGLGSGSGEIDLEILGKIQSKHPGISIHNEVVEPNPPEISKYKELVKDKGQGLNISFTWNQMHLEEYEKQNNERMANKKFDFIHMIQMLYFVESMHNTIKYFHSLLEKNGKLLIIYASANSGVHAFLDKFGPYFAANFFFDVCKVLDEMRMKYRISKVPAELDISECFIEGNKNGKLMESSMKPLSSDHVHYLKTFKVFLECSTEHMCMEKFIDENLPDILVSIGNKGNSSLNVLGVGSGSGQIDLKILGRIQSKHPSLPIHNEVVEPNPEQISSYQELVKEKGQDLNVTFVWNQMRSEEYEKQKKERNESKKFDFIHMIQILYYVESVRDTIKYFYSILDTNGKLLIINVSDGSGWYPLWKRFASRFPSSSLFLEVHKTLDELAMTYQIYELPSDIDITDCFIEGNEHGELLLDFLTEVKHFRKTAPADLKDEVLQYLSQPQNSREENGRIIFNNNLQAIVIDN